MGNQSQHGPNAPESSAGDQTDGRQWRFATESISGLPYEFRSDRRQVDRPWTSHGDRQAVVQRFNATCRAFTDKRLPADQPKSQLLMGLDWRDFERKPHLRFQLPLIEQQLAECLVEATVNPSGIALVQMLCGWIGCWDLMARVVVRAMLHPVTLEYAHTTCCLAPLPLKFGFNRSNAEHEAWLDLAPKLLADVDLVMRSGLSSNRLAAIVRFWKSMGDAQGNVGDRGILLTAIQLFCSCYPAEAWEVIASERRQLRQWATTN